ncbi:MAG: NAD(P)-dependent oxidoreductase [Candidatus Nanosalina sp.]
MKYVVTGSQGQVGSAVKGKTNTTGIDLEDADINQDVSEPEVKGKIIEEEPDVIVHCAAFHDLDAAEEEPEEAREVNVEGTRHISEAAEETDAHLIFISTDYVFDGERGDYAEDEERNPVSVYAKNKAEAEDVVRDSDAETTIFRPSVIFNGIHSNFFTWAKGELEDGGEVAAITDQTCCPTYAPNLAEFIVEAAEEGITGTYHATGDSKVTRYESVQIMNQELNLGGTVNRGRMDDLPWEAHRPKNSSLSLAKLKEDFETEPVSISEAFRRMQE